MVFDDRATELPAVLGVVERELVCGAGDANRLCAYGWARRLERGHRCLHLRALSFSGARQTGVQLLFSAQEAPAGDAYVVEDDFGRVAGADAVLLELLALAQAGSAGRDDEGRVAAGVQFGVDGQHEHVYVCDSAVGDPGLRSVQYPLVLRLVVDRPRLQ